MNGIDNQMKNVLDTNMAIAKYRSLFTASELVSLEFFKEKCSSNKFEPFWLIDVRRFSDEKGRLTNDEW